MAYMNTLRIIIFLILIPLIGHTTEDLKYSYIHDSIGDRDDAEGDVTFRTHQDNGVMYEYAHVNIKWKGGFFKSSITDDFIQKKEIKNGLVLYDIVEGDQKKGYSVFARHIKVKNYPVGFETKKIIKDEDRHPDFSDFDWIFKFKVENIESIEINGQMRKSVHTKLWGSRPTSTTNCKMTQPGQNFSTSTGEIYVETWFDLKDSKLLKQVFTKYGCVPSKRLVSKETWVLIN
ncbi:hypothetical protein K6112_07085 [Methylophilales bacterium]|nr:hypothetical protein K6112_07085 [Methylophilales bacterium]